MWRARESWKGGEGPRRVCVGEVGGGGEGRERLLACLTCPDTHSRKLAPPPSPPSRWAPHTEPRDLRLLTTSPALRLPCRVAIWSSAVRDQVLPVVQAHTPSSGLGASSHAAIMIPSPPHHPPALCCFFPLSLPIPLTWQACTVVGKSLIKIPIVLFRTIVTNTNS
jgi:hypothetical protein